MYGDIIVMSLVINISIKIISLQSVISRYIISASSLAEIFWKRLFKYNTIQCSDTDRQTPPMEKNNN